MTGSKEIKAVMAAMAQAQSAMCMPRKDGTNPHFRSKYATLGAVLEAIYKPCADAGLVVTQNVECDKSLSVVKGESTHTQEGMGDILITNVHHIESGEWISATARLLLEKQSPQGMGSAITYMRRYTLMAMFQLNAEDDDGQGAEQRGRTPNTPSQPTPTKPTKPTPAPSPSKKKAQTWPDLTVDKVIERFKAVKDEPRLIAAINSYAPFLKTCDAASKRRAKDAIDAKRASFQEPNEGSN